MGYTAKKSVKRQLANNLCSQSRTRWISTLQQNTCWKKYDVYFPYYNTDNVMTLRESIIFGGQYFSHLPLP